MIRDEHADNTDLTIGFRNSCLHIVCGWIKRPDKEMHLKLLK